MLRFKMITVGVLVAFILIVEVKSMQIIYEPCVYEAADLRLQISSRIWHIEKKSQVFYFSPCSKRIPECNSNAVCFKNKNSVTVNLGEKFISTLDDNDELVLKSINGEKCSQTKNWTAVVRFDCFTGNQLSPKFTLDEDDDCIYNIKMLKPDCPISCTGTYMQNIIDLRPLKGLNFIVREQNGSTIFPISICSTAKQCNADRYSACKIDGNGGTTLLGLVTNQRIAYKDNQIHITSKYHYTPAKSDYYLFELIIKCNLDVNYTEPTFLNPRILGRRHAFLMESSEACILKPYSCLLKDIEGYKYDLSPLYKPDGYWSVANISNGLFKINICSSMTANTHCRYKYSGVCWSDGATEENRGTLTEGFTVSENYLEIKFTDGSACKKNNSLRLSTKIKLVCSFKDEGPILTEENNCSYDILWETPAACPYYETINHDCLSTDTLGRRNLSVLHMSHDQTYNLNRNNFFRYNLCGILNNPCANQVNVSVCLHYRGKEYAVGLLNTNVKSFNGLLSMQLKRNESQVASNNNFPKTMEINFVCDYSVPPTGRFEFTQNFSTKVYTPSACLSNFKTTCKLSVGNLQYDLNDLTQNSRNYLIRDRNDPNLLFAINICRAVVTDENTLCFANSTICLVNVTEPNIKHRYKSISRLKEISYDNGALIIESQDQYCNQGMHYSSIMRFECSQEETSLPVLVTKSPCHFEFLWRTKKACPKITETNRRSKRSCTIKTTSEEETRLISLKSFDISDKTLVLKLVGCENKFSNKSSFQCNSREVKFDSVNGRIDIYNTVCDITSYKIQLLSCSILANKSDIAVGNDVINKLEATIQIQTNCESEMIKRENDKTIEVTENTLTSTATSEESTKLIKKTTTHTETNRNLEIPTQSSLTYTKQIKQANRLLPSCNKNGQSNAIINLNQLGSLNVTTSTQYVLNFDDTHKSCDGYICVNGSALALHSLCFSVNEKSLIFEGKSVKCDELQLKIGLFCNTSYPSLEIVAEHDCQVIMRLKTKPICSIFSSTTNEQGNVAAIVGGSLAVIIIVIIGSFLGYHKRHCFRKGRVNKAYTPIYIKDTQL